MENQTTDKLRVTLLQFDLKWEDKQSNLEYALFKILDLQGKTDVVILPELFSTGFTTNPEMAERNQKRFLNLFKLWALRGNMLIVGSFIAYNAEKQTYYNRGFYATGDNKFYYSDKKHLFRMSDEYEKFSPAATKKKDSIINFKGWNIRMSICYDLRFPVWCRNVQNEYDLFICIASWPASRNHVWDTLLTARAIENMSYVAGCNRIGVDGNGILYTGHSKVIDAKGKVIADCKDKEVVKTVVLSKTELEKFREAFPVWKDADKFNFTRNRTTSRR